MAKVREDGSKCPAGSWKKFQTTRATEDQVRAWYSNGCQAFGYFPGAVSGHLEMIEAEGRAVRTGLLRAAIERAERTGLGPLFARVLHQGLCDRTPSGGRHLHWRCPDGVEGNQKLACRPATAEELAADPDDKIKVLFETRGEGGFVVGAPSCGGTHPSGKPYKRLVGKFSSIPVVTAEEREALLDLFRSFDQMPQASHRILASDGWETLPGDDFATQTSWPEILEPHGWTALFTASDGNQHWRRPGKSEGTSATISENGEGVFYVFTSSSVFDPMKAYSKFGAYAILEHAGDFKAAALALHEKGYGKKLPGREIRPSSSRLRAEAASRDDGLISAAALLDLELPEPRWAIERLLPEGSSILAGRPKMGKSFLMLGVALGIARGEPVLGSLEVQGGPVLYLALEDTQRRLQKRLRMMLDGAKPPLGLTLATSWPRLNDGGLEKLELWLADHSEARLVVIDTLAKVRAPRRRNGNVYDEDQEAISGLKAIADRFGVAIVIVHHVRKMAADDFVDEVSGTLGLTGAADGILVLKRERGQHDAVLHVVGRDVEEQELALKFDQLRGTWTLLGEAADYRLSAERASVREFLAMGPASVSSFSLALGKSKNAAYVLLHRMVADGQIERDGRGQYRLPAGTFHIPVPTTTERKKEGKGGKESKESKEAGLGLSHLSLLTGRVPARACARCGIEDREPDDQGGWRCVKCGGRV